MTKRDYVLVAKALNKLVRNIKRDQDELEDLVDELCETFEQDNRRFDHRKFMDAVYTEI